MLVLPEQVNPYDGTPLSVAPFTWSHALLVSAVLGYLDAARNLRRATPEIAVPNSLERERENPVDNPGSFS